MSIFVIVSTLITHYYSVTQTITKDVLYLICFPLFHSDEHPQKSKTNKTVLKRRDLLKLFSSTRQLFDIIIPKRGEYLRSQILTENSINYLGSVFLLSKCQAIYKTYQQVLGEKYT